MACVSYFVAAALAWGTLAAAGAAPGFETAPGVVDLAGRPAERLPEDKASVRVFIFVRTDCPISNAYAPEIRRLEAEFHGSAAAFRLVYLDGTEPAAEIRRHLADYRLPMEALVDARHLLAKRCEVKVTPQSAVFREGALVYTGRIDDRYGAVGKPGAAPSTHDLEEAIAAALAGHPPRLASAPAVGCLLEDAP